MAPTHSQDNAPLCNKLHSIEVEKEYFLSGMLKVKNGELIQNALKNLTPDEREFLMTGICPSCWEEKVKEG